ncbi:MAG: Flp family type IVb pilin [Alphaproteobacteria bacterium]
MVKHIKHYLIQDDAATAIEYALIASGIAVAIAVTVVLLGESVLGLFNSVIAIF